MQRKVATDLLSCCYPATVDVRNSPPNLPIGSRDSATLIEDLCLALRDVAVDHWYLPKGARVITKIEDVQNIYRELSKRALDVQQRLEQLSLETGWRMNDLLADCSDYPSRIPYAKGRDGIREYFRCQLCATRERPDDADLNADFWMCDDCLLRCVTAIEERMPFPGIFLFRTYNASGRCCHADDETVLASIPFDDGGSFTAGRCKDCFWEEIQRRRNAPERQLSIDQRS